MRFIFPILRLFTNPINYLMLKFNKVKYKKFPRINGILKIIRTSKTSSIVLGENIVFNCTKLSNMIGGTYGCSIMMRSGGILYIGNNVGISNTAIVCSNSITIADHTIFGGGTKIWDTDFHSRIYLDRIEGDNKAESKPIIIGERSFIGGGVTVLKGVSIGCDCVIGANSVVTKSIPNSQIWAGNPAIFLKENN